MCVNLQSVALREVSQSCESFSIFLAETKDENYKNAEGKGGGCCTDMHTRTSEGRGRARRGLRGGCGMQGETRSIRTKAYHGREPATHKPGKRAKSNGQTDRQTDLGHQETVTHGPRGTRLVFSRDKSSTVLKDDRRLSIFSISLI